MNTEELDDFELSIRSKLADFEVTPPEGSWNAIVQNAGTESRKMRIVWFNRSSFFLIFFASMFSMWLAFGSINFELNKYEKGELKLLREIKETRVLLIEEYEKNGEDILEENFILKKNEENGISKDIIPSTEQLSIDEEIELAKNIETTNISQGKTSSLTLIKTLNETEQYDNNPFLHNRFSFYINAEQNMVYSKGLLNNIINDKLSAGSTIQFRSLVGVEIAYSLRKNIEVTSGIKYQRIAQQNKFIETESFSTTYTDSIIIGYIQHPVTGKTPVYEYKTVTENNFVNHQRSFDNVLHGVEIPISVSWRFYRKNNFSLSLNMSGTYFSIFAEGYKYFNDEGVLLNKNAEHINMFSSATSLLLDYRFNTFLSMYVKPMYQNSTNTLINNGAGLGVGIKYKFY